MSRSAHNVFCSWYRATGVAVGKVNSAAIPIFVAQYTTSLRSCAVFVVQTPSAIYDLGYHDLHKRCFESVKIRHPENRKRVTKGH